MTAVPPGWPAGVQSLFIVGNKRSGTSHLTRLLNCHPSVFLTHESDVMWILYQFVHRRPFDGYPWDGRVGMDATLAACAHLLRGVDAGAPGNVARLFAAVQLHLMRHGSAVQTPYPDKGPLLWLGDKKPVQQIDPEIHAFTRAHLPGVRYVHLVRHPCATVPSSLAAGATWAQVGYWQDTPAAVLQRWTTHEERVLAIQADATTPMVSVRFEDLCREPVQEMRKVFHFLGLDLGPDVAGAIAAMTHSPDAGKYARFELPLDERTAAIMSHHGYR